MFCYNKCKGRACDVKRMGRNDRRQKMENRTGQFIARRRKAIGLTQKELAEQLGVTNKAVSKWETGASQTKGY
jgi:DNA-binding transcriptional regulator YiaG